MRFYYTQLVIIFWEPLLNYYLLSKDSLKCDDIVVFLSKYLVNPSQMTILRILGYFSLFWLHLQFFKSHLNTKQLNSHSHSSDFLVI